MPKVIYFESIMHCRHTYTQRTDHTIRTTKGTNYGQ